MKRYRWKPSKVGAAELGRHNAMHEVHPSEPYPRRHSPRMNACNHSTTNRSGCVVDDGRDGGSGHALHRSFSFIEGLLRSQNCTAEETLDHTSEEPANDKDDQTLMKRFGVFGPPTIIFFDTDGAQRNDYEVVGYMKAKEFVAHVHLALDTVD